MFMTIMRKVYTKRQHNTGEWPPIKRVVTTDYRNCLYVESTFQVSNGGSESWTAHLPVRQHL